MAEEYEEITLADLVDTLLKRKVIVLVVLVACIGAGAALSSTQPVTYKADASFVALESGTITISYLESRQAAQDVQGLAMVEEGASTLQQMTEVSWEAVSTPDEVETPPDNARLMVTISVRHADAEVAAFIAEAYIDALPNVRPTLEKEFEDDRFQLYFDQSGNASQARELAKQDAAAKDFWLIFDDEATVSQQGGDSNLRLNLALGTVLGLMLGVFGAFTVEWWSNYRAERKRA